MSKYKGAMDSISVTKEMEERIMKNIEKKSVSQKSFTWVRYAAVAACCCLVIGGAVAYQSYEGKIDAKPEITAPGDAVLGEVETTLPGTTVPVIEGIEETEPTASVSSEYVPATEVSEPPVGGEGLYETTGEASVPIEETTAEPITPKPPVTTIPDIVLGQGEEVTTTTENIVLGEIPADTEEVGGEGVYETMPDDIEVPVETTGEAQIPNPIKSWETLDQLKAHLGFEIKVPTTECAYEPPEFKSILDMAEIHYVDPEANGCEVLNDITYRVAKGTADISGDYNQYSNIRTAAVNGCEVTFKTNGIDDVQLAVWTDGEYSYSLRFEHGASYERVIEIIESVR